MLKFIIDFIKTLFKPQDKVQVEPVGEPVSQDIHRYFSRRECLMGRDIEYPLTPELEANLVKLLTAINILREAYGKPMTISSLYRPGTYNKAAGGAKKSNHMVCLAADFRDVDGQIDEWCLKNLDVLAKAGLYLESPDYTVGWCHVQAVEPRSKNRVFKP